MENPLGTFLLKFYHLNKTNSFRASNYDSPFRYKFDTLRKVRLLVIQAFSVYFEIIATCRMPLIAKQINVVTYTLLNVLLTQAGLMHFLFVRPSQMHLHKRDKLFETPKNTTPKYIV